MNKRRNWQSLAAAIGLALFAHNAVRAQSYPTRPVNIVVPFPQGGLADVTARLMAPELSQKLKQAVVVENRPGAGGALGTAFVANANADGYTLLLGTSSTLSLLPLLTTKINIDPRTQLEPVTPIARTPFVFVVNPWVPAKTCPEFVDQAKGRPGKYHYSSTGNGTQPFMNAELFKLRAHVDIRHVPFRTISESIVHVVDGTVELTFQPTGFVPQLIDAGRLRPLGVTSEKRIPKLPGVPTMIECGFSGFVLHDWTALMVPAKTPDGIVNTLNEAVNEIIQSPKFTKVLAPLQVEPAGGSPKELAARIAADTERWSSLVRAARLKIE